MLKLNNFLEIVNSEHVSVLCYINYNLNTLWLNFKHTINVLWIVNQFSKQTTFFFLYLRIHSFLKLQLLLLLNIRDNKTRMRNVMDHITQSDIFGITIYYLLILWIMHTYITYIRNTSNINMFELSDKYLSILT